MYMILNWVSHFIITFKSMYIYSISYLFMIHIINIHISLYIYIYIWKRENVLTLIIIWVLVLWSKQYYFDLYTEKQWIHILYLLKTYLFIIYIHILLCMSISHSKFYIWVFSIWLSYDLFTFSMNQFISEYGLFIWNTSNIC